MGAQLLELKWANHKSNMTLELQELYLSDALLDVTIACGDSSLKAHKTVLSASSAFFRKLFIDNPCKHPILVMTDIDFEDMKAIVQFMYKGEICISREKLTQFLKTADRLKVKGLTSIEHMDINPSQHSEIDVDPQHAQSVWACSSIQSKAQDTPEAKNVCNSKKVTDCIQNDTSQGVATVKSENDLSRTQRNNCMYWQNECFDQTSSSSVLPDCTLPSSPAPPVSHQPPVHSVSHQLSVQSVSYKQSPSDLTGLQQHDDPSVSHQLESSSNSEAERFTYSEIQSDRGTLVQEPEPEDVVSRDIVPVSLYQSQDQSPVTIPSNAKSFETIETLTSQSSSQDGKSDEATIFVTGPYQDLAYNSTFCTKSYLQTNMRTHTSRNAFICSFCPKQFTRLNNLKCHQRTHTGEKPFSCKVCNKRFAHVSNLRTHERIHSGEKPFWCKVCGKQFTHLSNMRGHERTHMEIRNTYSQ